MKGFKNGKTDCNKYFGRYTRFINERKLEGGTIKNYWYIYRKGLEIATNPKIKKLMEQYKKYKEIYGEEDKKTLKIAKKIDEETHKIYNN